MSYFHGKTVWKFEKCLGEFTVKRVSQSDAFREKP